MLQLSFPLDADNLAGSTVKRKPLIGESFSHNHTCEERARLALEQKYGHLLQESERFNRQLVSFQANKIETLHKWIKYREGFSAQLVEILLSEFGVQEGQAVLDPFAGSCTTLLEAKLNGIDAVGVELLPHCHLAWQAKSNVFAYDVDELLWVCKLIQQAEPPASAETFSHLRITEGAFSEDDERAIVNYLHWFAELEITEQSKTLCRALLMSILEEVSYTRKDGQYLRWDGRSQKIIARNKVREAQGKPFIAGIDKGELPTVRQALLEKLSAVVRDIVELQLQTPLAGKQQLLEGNSLYVLPQLDSEQFDAVITSPPYANRYDYTRTYALELAFLEVEQDIFNLRQNLLSCTVENKPKFEKLRALYEQQGRLPDYNRVIGLIESDPVLCEISKALKQRNARGEINNKGVLRMIDLYFSELAFIYAELFRVCRSGAQVAFVNDNVRYAGEVIPVDLISTSLAESLGFVPETVYVLPQRKGNSSQQMGKFGRRALRKSITIWKKP